MKFNSLVNSKSRSMIRIDEFQKKKPTHFEVIKYIKDNFYEDTVDFVCNIKQTFTYSSIDNIIEIYEGYLSINRIEVIKKFLKRKLDLLIEVYKLWKGLYFCNMERS
ncbi:MAG: hypothetical protein ACERKV_07270 [Clostridiaceae bacterium]